MCKIRHEVVYLNSFTAKWFIFKHFQFYSGRKWPFQDAKNFLAQQNVFSGQKMMIFKPVFVKNNQFWYQKLIIVDKLLLGIEKIFLYGLYLIRVLSLSDQSVYRISGLDRIWYSMIHSVWWRHFYSIICLCHVRIPLAEIYTQWESLSCCPLFGPNGNSNSHI